MERLGSTGHLTGSTFQAAGPIRHNAVALQLVDLRRTDKQACLGRALLPAHIFENLDVGMALI